jgi:fructokinase
MDDKKKLISFGEILWDILPSGQQPGGAPMNVALRAQSLGMASKIISRVGNDKFGKDIVQFISERGAGISLIGESNHLPTGLVKVSLDSNGVASYDIVYPSAWDRIDLKEEALAEIKASDVFVFGTLAVRDEYSRKTLFKLIDHAPYSVFDINLRPPHYDLSIIIELGKKADLIKLNDEELLILVQELGSKSESIDENILFLSKEIECESICITKGADGAILYTGDQFYSHPGFKIEVVDTVGSGDSFLATLIYHILYHFDYSKALEIACAMGSLVATKQGANALITNDEIAKLIAN